MQLHPSNWECHPWFFRGSAAMYPSKFLDGTKRWYFECNWEDQSPFCIIGLYVMETCTPFCARLYRMVVQIRCPPSRADLDSLFYKWESDLARGLPLGTFQELQSRKCPFCQLATAAVLHSVPNPEQVSPAQPIDVVLFPEETGFRLSFPSRLGTQLLFVATNESQVVSPDCARIIGASQILPETISNWLHQCDNNHPTCVRSTRPNENTDDSPPRGVLDEKRTSNFRVLDLEDRCIKNVELHVRYVTLSYVWGQVSMFQLQKENFKALSSPGSLDLVLSSLPKTVKSAINLVESIGERYLWIDALCLIQDDTLDVNLGIEFMNSIYQGSYFTLVAATGADSNAGLPGFQESRAPSFQIVQELVPRGIHMAAIHSIDWHIEKSAYSSRGWTMQELVLPRRTVISINNQVYFRCQEANWSEETWSDKYMNWLDPDDSNINRIPDRLEGRVRFLWVYQKLFEDYSRRVLRNDGDALRAVAGISRPIFSGMRTIGIEGLPGYFLDMFLLFMSPECRLRRRPEFASFSWAGWEGKILWPRENYVAYDENSQSSWSPENISKYFASSRLIEWAVWPRNQRLKKLSHFEVEASHSLRSLLQEFPSVFSNSQILIESNTLSWLEVDNGLDFDIPGYSETETGRPRIDLDLVQTASPGIVELDRQENKETSYLEQNYQQEILFSTACLWQKEHYYFRGPRYPINSDENLTMQKEDERVQSMKARSITTAPLLAEIQGPNLSMPNFPPYAILCFQSIVFNLAWGQKPTSWKSDPLPRPNSMPADFHAFEDIPLHSARGDMVGSLHPDSLDFVGQAGEKVELVVVARCQTLAGNSALWKSHLIEKSSGKSAHGPWDLLWVLSITWINGIAERRGVGQVLTKSLAVSVEPKPEVKQILLG